MRVLSFIFACMLVALTATAVHTLDEQEYAKQRFTQAEKIIAACEQRAK